jgi:lysophospholipase L1-like esterase
VTFDEVGIADSQSGATLVPGSLTPVSFAGNPSVIVPAGREAVSDPVSFRFSAFQNLAVSMYLKGSYVPTEHASGRQISYGTLPLAGNHVADPSAGPFSQSTTARYFLSGLDVQAGPSAGTVVTFGDSITDGYQGPPSLVPENTATLNLNARYPDWLARRLLAAHSPLSVANAGISGNRILQNGQIPMFGPSGLSRFTQDAIDQPGVSTILILEGTNDIGQSNATAAQIIGGLTQLAGMARAAHIRVLLGTLTPMSNAAEAGYSGAAPNATREQVNAWIRTQHVANGYVDFDKAVRDPSDPSIINPSYDGGDGLHFDPSGYHAMADAINLAQLATPRCGQPKLRLTVTPRVARAGIRTLLRFRVTTAAHPALGVLITIAGHRLHTNRHGTAALRVRFTHQGRVRVSAATPGEHPAHTTIKVLRPSRAARPGSHRPHPEDPI